MGVQGHPAEQSWASYVVTFTIMAVVIALRMRSMGKERPLRLETLWIVPVAYLLLAVSMIYALWPTAIGWLLLLAGLVLGLAIGWHRGKLIRIDRNPETGALRQKASPLAMLLLLALVILKLGARAIFGQSAAGQPGSTAMLLTDAFIGFALGLLSATRLEIYIRVRKLLENG